MKFTKMQAYGNDYVYVNAIDQTLGDLSELARFVSDRHFAIGSDGLILICPSETADFRMRVFNPDGSEGEMCGNALRSVGKYVYDHRLTEKTALMIETLGGVQQVWLTVGDDDLVSNIRADIGAPRLAAADIPVVTAFPEFVDQPVEVLDRTFFMTAVSWGNPHCAMYVDSVAALDVARYGREIENRRALFPNRTNVTFAEFLTRDHIRIREWERGTGETIGCGTGCATAVVAGVLTGRLDRRVTAEQIGGPLLIEWEESTGHLFMTGPSHTVFEGEIDISHLGQSEA